MARPINEAERQARLAEVDMVVDQLRTAGEKVTRRKIADGIGVTEQALHAKDHDGNRNYLAQYVDGIIEADKLRAAEAVGDVMTYADLLATARAEISSLKKELKKVQHEVESLKHHNGICREQYDKLQMQFEAAKKYNDYLITTIHQKTLEEFNINHTRID